MNNWIVNNCFGTLSTDVIFQCFQYLQVNYFHDKCPLPLILRAWPILLHIVSFHYLLIGEQGWRSGESARFPPMWPGFDSRTRRHMWVEFVVGSRPCSEGFSPGSPVFLPPQKPTLPNSN